MIRTTLHITYDRRVGLLLIVLALSLLLSGSVAVFEQPAIAGSRAQLIYTPREGGRHFYLTDANYATNEVLTACANGYHMASLWEILDVSNLIYDYDHPAAHTKADSGFGPPSFWHGWVRTGWSSSGSSTTGIGNCRNWTSVASTDYGVSVRLSRAWEAAPGDILTWDANSFSCNIIGPVWCVGDFYAVYLPLALTAP